MAHLRAGSPIGLESIRSGGRAISDPDPGESVATVGGMPM
jgi:hypothetical protein